MTNSSEHPHALKLELASALVALVGLTLVVMAQWMAFPRVVLGGAGVIIIVADLLVCAFFWWEWWQGLKRAPDRREYALSHGVWLLGAIPLLWHLRWIQAFRLLRLARHLRLSPRLGAPWRAWTRALSTHPLDLLGAASVLLLVLGGTALYWFEHLRNSTVRDWWGALWLATTSATTVTYGDIWPQTVAGRVLSALISICGIVIVGSLTGVIAGHVIREPHPQGPSLNDISARLERIEERLTKLG